MACKLRGVLIGTLVGGIALPGVTSANALIPYLWVPVIQLAIFPVIVGVEAVVFKAGLTLRLWPAVWRALVSNLASTVAGAAVYFGLMPLLGESMWDFWMVHQAPAAVALSIGVASVLFLLSWLLESVVVHRTLRGFSKRPTWRTVLIANLITYGGLLTLTLVFA